MFVFNLFVVLVGFTLSAQASSWRKWGISTCGLEPGESMCTEKTKSCDAIVVRPHDVPKPPITTTLAAVPSPCACKKAIVRPAILPRPVCRQYGCGCKCTCGCGCDYVQNCCTCGSQNLHDLSKLIYTTGPTVTAPADAVSIAIAQQNAKNCFVVEEDKLAYGFRKLPINPPKPKIVKENNIPEEKIFSLNGQIVELKPVVCTSTKSLDEEAVEELLALEEEEESKGINYGVEHCAIKKISLGELGYAPAIIKKKTFVDLVDEEESSVETSSECSDPYYKPGDTVFKTVSKPASIIISTGREDTTDCESRETGAGQYEEEYYPKYTPRRLGQKIFHRSSSSSSCSQVKKASVIIEKLCSND